jgi:Methylmalonyl-CoA mutase
VAGVTESGTLFAPVYGTDALLHYDAGSALGQPGAFPYTRGVYPTMYHFVGGGREVPGRPSRLGPSDATGSARRIRNHRCCDSTPRPLGCS